MAYRPESRYRAVEAEQSCQEEQRMTHHNLNLMLKYDKYISSKRGKTPSFYT
jgi:hypothetical protein